MGSRCPAPPVDRRREFQRHLNDCSSCAPNRGSRCHTTLFPVHGCLLDLLTQLTARTFDPGCPGWQPATRRRRHDAPPTLAGRPRPPLAPTQYRRLDSRSLPWNGVIIRDTSRLVKVPLASVGIGSHRLRRGLRRLNWAKSIRKSRTKTTFHLRKRRGV